ncbi:MAG: response regulator [Candidatus Pacebacteria bacterium]|nr:response regulator [Candidatus Paceibacterota bacterium]
MNDMNEQKKVLVVDDEEALTTVLARKFTEEGMMAYTAFNGKTGLEIALEKHPDVILLDIMMPEMDGLEVMKILREDDWGKNIPIILLTNSSSYDTVEKAVGIGMSEFLVKDELKLDEVVERVKKHFRDI